MDQDRRDAERPFHVPVLVEEVVELVSPVLPGVVVDATFGGGGHSRRLLDEFGAKVKLIGIDRDPAAVANGAAIGVEVRQGNFGDLADLVGDVVPNAVLFDFGISSHQVDEASRGFSYRHEGPLDMRMGPDADIDADEIVNHWPEPELIRIISSYGEEPFAPRIARAIVAARPIESTAALSTIIAEAMPAARRRAGHPARRTFQALRMTVNAELSSISTGLDQAISMIPIGGRVIAISYHSLEDRIVKTRFAEGARGCTCPPDLPVCGCGNTAELRILTRKPITASREEVASNNRARSAKLRAVERVAA